MLTRHLQTQAFVGVPTNLIDSRGASFAQNQKRARRDDPVGLSGSQVGRTAGMRASIKAALMGQSSFGVTAADQLDSKRCCDLF